MDQGHDESGALIPVEGFDYAAVDRNHFDPGTVEELSKLSAEQMDAGIKLNRCTLEWIFADGMNNKDGVAIRAILCCWIYLPWLRPLTMEELAAGFGMDKQSFGRWHDVFKKDFPFIRTPHMRIK